jgi:hypothetical protein
MAMFLHCRCAQPFDINSGTFNSSRMASTVICLDILPKPAAASLVDVLHLLAQQHVSPSSQESSVVQGEIWGSVSRQKGCHSVCVVSRRHYGIGY